MIFYALVMLVTVGGHSEAYVVDRMPTAKACQAALPRATEYRHVAKVTFQCERTIVVPR